MKRLPSRAELDLGGGRTIGFTVSLIRSEQGEPRGTAVFFRDLTAIEHEEEQERTRDRLAALGQMAASLAHEIRNPLAGIEVTCSLLRRRLDEDPTSHELLQKITREVRRLNATVNSSLEYVRPVHLDLDYGRLDPLLDEAIAVAVGRHGGGGITIERRYAPMMPCFLMDRHLLRQVFENLILNAMEALGSRRGNVIVTTEVVDTSQVDSVPYRPSSSDPWQGSGQCAVVRVRDNGPGIDPEDLDRIFHPLFTTKKEGSGIGLPVVRKIVNSHRGLIDVVSTPGEGAEFAIRLPMALEPAEV